MKNRKVLLNLLVLTAFCSVSMSVMSEIYTWKDSSGKTVYSDRPPTGVTAQEMKIKPSKVRSKQNTPVTQAEASDTAQEVAKKNAQIKAQNDKAEEANTRIKEQNCKNAKQALGSIQGGMRIAVPDGKGGKSYPNDKERNQMLQKANEDVRTWCN